MNDAMVKANTSTAAITTEPLPAMDRMMSLVAAQRIANHRHEDQRSDNGSDGT